MTEKTLSLHGNTWGSIFLTSLFCLGLVCLISLVFRFFWLRSPQEREGKVEAWSIKWVDFGLFVWILFLCILLTSGISDFLLGKAGREAVSTDAWWNILNGLFMHGGMVGVFCLYRFYRPQLFNSRLNTQRLPVWKAFSLGGYLFLASLPAVWYVASAWQQFIIYLNQAGLTLPENPQPLVEVLFQEQSLLARVALVLVATATAPIVEELIFRGALYRFLKNQIPSPAAAVSSAVIFGLMHFNLISFLPLVVLGIFLCISYEISGNLKVPILFHALFNIHSILLITFSPELLKQHHTTIPGLWFFGLWP